MFHGCPRQFFSKPGSLSQSAKKRGPPNLGMLSIRAYATTAGMDGCSHANYTSCVSSNRKTRIPASENPSKQLRTRNGPACTRDFQMTKPGLQRHDWQDQARCRRRETRYEGGGVADSGSEQGDDKVRDQMRARARLRP